MPPLTRWFVKTALVYLVAALGLGVALAGGRLGALPAPGALAPVYFHLFMVGWVTQLIFGVSLWMFPRDSRERPRGSPVLGWTVFATLNLGLLLRVAAEPLAVPGAGPAWGRLLVLSAALQWLGGALYAVAVWPRVRER